MPNVAGQYQTIIARAGNQESVKSVSPGNAWSGMSVKGKGDAKVSQKIIRITNEKDWLEARKSGIGASEAASILGISPYKTSIELWEEKTGKKEPEDISDNPFVKYGKAAEEHLRALFALDFPQYEVRYAPYKMFQNSEHPFIFATLDGWLVEMDDSEPMRKIKRYGVLEIKTAEIMQGSQWAKWKDRIPDQYYVQCCHQLLATGFDFVILKAQLKSSYRDDLRIETKHYKIDRKDVMEDIEYLKSKEIEFWTKYVEAGKKPPLALPSI